LREVNILQRESNKNARLMEINMYVSRPFQSFGVNACMACSPLNSHCNDLTGTRTNSKRKFHDNVP
jgi:hypothetical protein